MKIGSIILGRPWIYDVDLTLYGCTNQCSFLYDGRKIQLYRSPPKSILQQSTSPQAQADATIPLYDKLVPASPYACSDQTLLTLVTASTGFLN